MFEARFQRPRSEYPTQIHIGDQNETRVFDLLPGSFNDGIRCKLSVQPLKEVPNSLPIYNALSYVWGDWTNHVRIQLESISNFPITYNLSLALRRLRDRKTPIRLWVDQISINQQCKKERKQQVKQIGEIFHRAEKVFLWFGDVDGDGFLTADEALKQMINRFDKYLASDTVREKNTIVDKHGQNVLDPWFTRAWMLEEFALARNDPIVIFGSHRRPWSSFSGKASLVSTSQKNLSFLYRMSTYEFLRDETFRKNIFSLSTLLQETETLEPRDKIFCIRPSLPDAEKEKIVFDYDKPISHVFAEATHTSIAASKSIGILILSRLSGQSTIAGLPSWAVDFTFPSKEQLRLCPFDRSSIRYKLFSPMFRVYQESKVRIIAWIFDFEASRRSWCKLCPRQDAQVSNLDPLHPERISLGGLMFDSISSVVAVEQWRSPVGPRALLRFYSNLLMPITQSYFSAKVDYATLKGLERKIHSAIEHQLSTGEPYRSLSQPLENREERRLIHEDANRHVMNPFNIRVLFRAWDRAARPSDAGFAHDWDMSLLPGEQGEGEATSGHMDDEVAYGNSGDWFLRDIPGKFRGPLFRTYLLVNPDGHIFFSTKSGFVGVGPKGWRRDDLVMHPYGSHFPIALRKAGKDTWTFVGFIYVRGIVENELWDCYPDIQLPEFDFVLV